MLLPAIGLAQDQDQGGSTPTRLSPDLEMTWWAIDDSDPDFPRFVGDVMNISDKILDAPVVGITAYDAEGNITGSGYARPEPPVLEPGARAYLNGFAPDDIVENAEFEFFICPEPEISTSYVDHNAALDIQLGLDGEKRNRSSFRAIGTVQNNGDIPAEMVAVIALFVNPNGQVVGSLATYLDRAIPAGKSMKWSIDHGVKSFHSNHPFTDRLDQDYDVTYWAGYATNARFIFC
jgi:hypothetical protein